MLHKKIRALGLFSAAAFGAALLAVPAAAQTATAHVDRSAQQPVFYPKTSQVNGEEGNVYVSIYVRDDGKPVRASLMKSSGYDDLDTAAIQSAMNWTYVPAMEYGENASGWTTVQVVYKLPKAAAK
jgi:TonB family protein